MNWIKKNKLTTALILIVLFFVFKGFFLNLLSIGSRKMVRQPALEAPGIGGAPSLSLRKGIIPPPRPKEYPPVEKKERLVVEESSMSLVVLNVRETANGIIDYAKRVGGFMVSSSLSRPEEAPFATVVVRVPSEKFRQTLKHFRNLAVKVSSESILGTDVTSEYTDIQARLATLERTKAKFESILDEAIKVQDILTVQQELINLQDKIDSLKGRQKYLEQTAKLARITVYLSTDELALPYAPAKPFRPTVIFKMAVRSLIRTLRSLFTLVIWVAVYSVIWLPVLLIIYFAEKWRKKKSVEVE